MLSVTAGHTSGSGDMARLGQVSERATLGLGGCGAIMVQTSAVFVLNVFGSHLIEPPRTPSLASRPPAPPHALSTCGEVLAAMIDLPRVEQ